jgi:hypothetical protein
MEGNKSLTVQCPVHMRTEDNPELPNEEPTAPRLLGAIKWTLRRMKQVSKHTLSTLKLRDSVIMPLKWSREIWAHFLSRYSVVLLLRSLHICVCCCCIMLLCAHSIPSLTLVLIVINCVRHEILQFMEITHNWDIDIRKTTMAPKFDLWITWEGFSATLDQNRSPQRGVGIGRTTVKIVVSLVHFTYCDYCLLEFSYSLAISLLSLILILKEQSSEELFFLLSSHPNLVLVHYHIS